MKKMLVALLGLLVAVAAFAEPQKSDGAGVDIRIDVVEAIQLDLDCNDGIPYFDVEAADMLHDPLSVLPNDWQTRKAVLVPTVSGAPNFNAIPPDTKKLITVQYDCKVEVTGAIQGAFNDVIRHVFSNASAGSISADNKVWSITEAYLATPAPTYIGTATCDVEVEMFAHPGTSTATLLKAGNYTAQLVLTATSKGLFDGQTELWNPALR
jgi:hypothetical protein